MLNWAVVYLIVGHYNPVSHDREIFQYAFMHELTHLLGESCRLQDETG